MSESVYEPTNRLRWAEWYVEQDTETGDIQWRTVPVEVVND